MKTLILSISDIARIVNKVGLDQIMDDMIHRLHHELKYFDPSSLHIPLRKGFEYNRPDVGLLEWMPILRWGEKATFKMVGYHPTNPAKRGLPTIVSTISTYDTANGHLKAMADATFLTALRTGAASAVASRIAGHPDTGVVGIIGCGAQAVTQLHALSRIFKIEKVNVYDIDPAAATSFISRTGFLGLDVRTTALDELVAGADIICSATSVEKGKGPVFTDGAVKPWLHINAVGSDFPGKTELPKSLLERSFVFPDFLAQAITEGECQQLDRDAIGPNLAHVVKHEQDYLDYRSKISVFDSTGWALEDQLAMEMLIEHAERFGLGRRVQIESRLDDPKHPYDFLNVHNRRRPSDHDGELHQRMIVRAS